MLLSFVLAATLAAPAVARPPQSSAPHVSRRVMAPELFAAGEDRLLAVRDVPPWHVRPRARFPGQSLRVFGRRLFAVDPPGGAVLVVDHPSGVARTLDFGATSEPQDVLALGRHAFVTLRNESALRHVDLATGRVRGSVDLAPLARPGETVALGRMIRDGLVLFVQVKVVGGLAHGDPYDDRGLLAVVDLLGEALLDADPLTAGVQGIALAGAPPLHDMQIVETSRTLFVSTTDGYLDGRGGIEMVALDTWRSLGFALHEQEIADLGGFVMTSPTEGFFVFHTDLLASTHLKPFTVGGGVPAGPEMVVFFDVVDELAYDPLRERVHLPGRYGSATPLVHAFDARTHAPVVGGPIVLPEHAYDVLVAPR
jgi:hypothetical protein